MRNHRVDLTRPQTHRCSHAGSSCRCLIFAGALASLSRALLAAATIETCRPWRCGTPRCTAPPQHAGTTSEPPHGATSWVVCQGSTLMIARTSVYQIWRSQLWHKRSMPTLGVDFLHWLHAA